MKKLEQERVSPESSSKKVRAPNREDGQKQPTALHSAVLDMQRSVGNQAVGQLLASSGTPSRLHASQGSDRDELEADRVADQLVSVAAPSALHQKCSCE